MAKTANTEPSFARMQPHAPKHHTSREWAREISETDERHHNRQSSLMQNRCWSGKEIFVV